MTRRVLFVDDEPNLLDGLRRMFRPLRGEWEMRFAGGGAEALAVLARDPIDVLVTDMRMPGMDGDELLAQVRARSPLTVRIVLTGQCTREAMLRLVPLAHRVFTKPCDPDELTHAVRRACSLQDLLRSPSLAALVGRLGGLPSPPALYTRVLAELDRPDGSIAAVGDLLADDVGMTAKLLQVANSALVDPGSPVASPGQAVRRLGAETTKALVLASEVFSRYDPAPLRPFSIDDLWDHSQAVAALAGRISRAETGRDQLPDAQLAGLLHDVGRLTLASQEPEAYKEVLQLVRDARATVVDAERQVFGATHAEVGAYLLGLWGLPGPLVETVAWHHAPAGCPADGFGPLAAVHAAETILAPGESGPADTGFLDRLGLGDRLPLWVDLNHRAGPAGMGT